MKTYVVLFTALALGRYYGGKEDVKEDFYVLVDQAQQCTSVLGYLVSVLLVVSLLALLAVYMIDRKYKKLVELNSVKLDPWVQQPKGPSLKSKMQLLFSYWMSAGGHQQRTQPVDLAEQESSFMDGLKVAVKQGQVADSVPHKMLSDCIVVGTIRMGFGHHRIAYAVCSWSLKDEKSPTYFHDLLNIDSPEATLIKDMDKMYSKGSRLASELGGVVEKTWGALTLSGDADSLRATYQMAEVVKPLLMGLPKDAPIVATHCLVGLCAVACGFTNVINLVIDNHAQWFVVVPGALNLVQGPTNYAQLLKMGVPPQELKLAGHWIPCDLVDNLDNDCNARIARATSEKSKPLRLLIPVGGAGAQRLFVTKLVKALVPRVRKGDVQLFLNAGDHEHMKVAFMEVLDSCKQAYDIVDTMKGVHDFCDALRQGKEPAMAVTLFAFKDYFPAVATTDLVCRVTDILACKPSELAFYPVPKLMIRRVGDHEAYSALRASELGDGTLEARTIKDSLRYVELFKDTPGSPLLVSMNEMIKKNGKIGVYNGCKTAVDIARRMKSS